MRQNILVSSCAIFALAIAPQAIAATMELVHYDAINSGIGPVSIFDISGEGNDGVPVPVLGASLDVPSSPRAGALSFNTTSGSLRTVNTQLLNNADIDTWGGFSYDVWVNWDGTPNGFSKVVDYAGTEAIRLDETGTVIATLNSATTVTGPAISANEWHHLLYIFNTAGNTVDGDGFITGDLTLVVDGVPTVAAGVTKDLFGDGLDRPISVGDHPVFTGGVDHFSGLIYDPIVSLGAIPVPEPSSLALILAATLGVVGCSSRKR